MHELPVTEGILRTVLKAAGKAGAQRITEIRLKVGVLSGVVPECIQEYLDMIAAGTVAEGARIIAEEAPIRILCRSCKSESPVTRGTDTCPLCGSRDFKIVAGWEVEVGSITAE